MGDLGSAIGALLQGASQGFLEAKEEDKIKVQQDKDKATLRKRETAKLLLQNPNLRREAQGPILAFLAGTPGSEKDFLEIVATQELPGTEQVIPELQQGVSPVVNQQGKLAAGQNQAFALPGEGPVPLQLPPAESFAPLEDFQTAEPAGRQGIFRTEEEDLSRAKELRRDLASEERSEAQLTQDLQFANQTAQLEDSIEQLFEGVAIDDPLKQAALRAIPLAVQGQPTLLQNVLARQASPTISQSEVAASIANLDLTTLKNTQVLAIIAESNPLGYAGLGVTRDEFIRSTTNQQRKALALEVRGKTATAALNEARASAEGLSDRSNALLLAGLGDLDLKDVNTHIGRLRTLEKNITDSISAITVKQHTPDSLTGKPPEENFVKAMDVTKNLLVNQAIDVRNQIDQFIKKRDTVLGDGPGGSTEPQIPPIATPEDAAAFRKSLEDRAVDDPDKVRHIVSMLASLPEPEAFNLANDFRASDDPRFRMDPELFDIVIKRSREARDKLAFSPRQGARNRLTERPELAEFRR